MALVVGARPNFMKAAPLVHELKKSPDLFEPLLIHTGQHYDHNLSQLFFENLEMPQPDINLGVGSGSHAAQTGNIMIGLERIFSEFLPDIVVVFGDVNSTMAGAIVAKKLHMKVAHVEAGLRSFDMDMPEEINRIVTDRLSEYLFVSEKSGLVNLKNEGLPDRSIFFVGNIMIDSLMQNLKKAKKSNILDKLSLEPQSYIAMTMHRPTNVDEEESLANLLKVVVEISQRLLVVFPCHPRTRERIEQFNLRSDADSKNLKIIEPIGYLDFLKLQMESKLVLTDSGGIQEETTYLQIPCVTIRKNTERPVTVEVGTNTVAGTDPKNIFNITYEILNGTAKKGKIPELWDGKTAVRIVDILKDL
jgi:UDP-N-acetylglucosamine 2-epimerase (non-hydrolysing)